MVKGIVLINTPLSESDRFGVLKGYIDDMIAVQPPLGLCYLAAYIRQNGYEARILDSLALHHSIEQAAAEAVKFGFKYIGLTSATMAIGFAHDLARKIKEKAPGTTVIIGGPHITALPQDSMERFPNFDFGVMGEGELILKELLDSLEAGLPVDAIKGIVFRKDGAIIRNPRQEYLKDLDTLPMPAWDLLPELIRHYRLPLQNLSGGNSFSVITSRGCPSKCTFCDRAIFGAKFRRHSPFYVVEMLKDLYHKHGVRHIHFHDDNFFVNRQHMIDIFSLIKKEKMQLTWSSLGRVDFVDRDILKMAREAGCVQLFFGIESGSQKILDTIRKGITPVQVKTALEITKSLGIETAGCVMVGNPGETRETLEETLKFLRGIKLDSLSMTFTTPFPNTDLWNSIEHYGVMKKDWNNLNVYEPVFIPYGLDSETLKYYMKTIIRKFYFRPSFILTHLGRLFDRRRWKNIIRGALQLFLLSSVKKNA